MFLEIEGSILVSILIKLIIAINFTSKILKRSHGYNSKVDVRSFFEKKFFYNIDLLLVL